MSQVNSIFVLDNGAHTIKAGFAPTDEDRDAALARLTSQRRQKGPWNSKANKALAQQLEDQVDSRYECVTVSNSIARRVKDKVTYVADELAQCSDYGGLVFRTPFERVCLVVGGMWGSPHPSFSFRASLLLGTVSGRSGIMCLTRWRLACLLS